VDILNAVMKFVLTVLALMTAGIEKEPPPPGTLVNSDPSPINLARIVAAEIVVKNPKLVEIEFVEILHAVMKFVLTVLALITAGIEKDPPPPPGTLVNSDPSPINLARIVAAEIVVKNPKLVEIEFVEILHAVTRFVLTVFALITAGIEKEPPPPPPGTLVNKEPSPMNLP
jgi:hypothetical protein